MNTPNPLIPQGSLQPQNYGRSNIRIAVFAIIAIHAVLFGGILMQGCKRDNKLAKTTGPTNALSPLDSNYYTDYGQIAGLASNQPALTPQPQPQTPPSTPIEPAPQIPPSESKEYTIAKGDTFSSIAKANQTTVAALLKANPTVDPNRLRPTQKIVIPPPTATTPAESDANVHVVKPGENLTKIAKQHGTTVKAIKAANNLRTDRVVVDQKLKLPRTDSNTIPAALPSTTTNPAPLPTGTSSTQLR